jgi:hypothetical protein
MATVTPNFNWPVPTSTDLVKDGATAIEALGDSIDASLVDLKGGTTGQVLSKTSGTDMDFTWVTSDDANAIQNTIVDAKGDLIAATAADTPARLAVGTNGQVLTADSTTATGLKWAASSSGSPLTTKGDLYTYSTTDTRLAVGGDYGFLSALASESTGLKWDSGAYTSYTPTLSASSGSFTSASVAGNYKRIGKVCVTRFQVTITTNGTASGVILITMPFTSTGYATGTWREVQSIGNAGQTFLSSSTQIGMTNFSDNSYPGANGRTFQGTIIYEVA